MTENISNNINIDDAPLKGGGGSFLEMLEKQLAAEKQEENQAQTDMNLPLSDRVSNKNWKVRKNALEEINTKIKDLKSFDSELFELFPKIITDQHQGNLEEAVNILTTYFENKFPVPKESQQFLNSIIKNLIEKCFTTSKTAFKDKSRDLIIRAIEFLNTSDVLCENISALLVNKNQKLSQAAVAITNILLPLYGNEVINYKKISPSMFVLAEKCSPLVKQQIVEFFIELYKWIKKGLMPLITKKVKDNIKNDIEKGIEQINEKFGLAYFPTPTKFLGRIKIGGNKNNKTKDVSGIDNDGDVIMTDMTEVDIFTKKFGFDDTFISTMLKKETKWKEKKQAFDTLTELTNPEKLKHIKNTNRFNFVDMVKKLLKEPNINVSHSVINALSNLSVILGNNFTEGRELFSRLVDFFKEKKEPFINSLITCLLNISENLDESTISDMLLKYASSNNLCIAAKIHLCTFIEKLFDKKNKNNQMNNLVPVITNIIIKYIDDPSQEIRNEGTKIMAQIKSQKSYIFNINAVKSALNDQKNKKIDDYMKANNMVGAGSIQSNDNENINNNFDQNKNKKIKNNNNKKNDLNKSIDSNRSFCNNDNSTENNKKNIKNKSRNKQSNLMPSASADNINNPQEENINLSNKEDISEVIKQNIGDEIFSLFKSSKWTDRKSGFTELNKFMSDDKNFEIVSNNYDYFIKFILLNNKSFKENNPNLLNESFPCIITLINKIPNFAKKYYCNFIKLIIDKVTDKKIQSEITNLIQTLIDKTSPKEVIFIYIKYLRNKQPIFLKEGTNILHTLLENAKEIQTYPIKEIVDFCCVLENNTNAQCRNIGTTILCTLYKFMGKSINTLLKDIKDTTLKTIEKEFSKIQPISNDKIGKAIVDEIFPRTDISKKITPNILKTLNEGKWANKKDAIIQIENIIISTNKKILSKGLNDLFSAIKNNLKDSNKNIVKLILKLICDLAEALGPQGFKIYQKQVMLGILSNLQDKNTQVREEAIKCINTLITILGFDSIVTFLPSHLMIENFESRLEILKILLNNKANINSKKEYIKEFVKPLINCLLDRNLNIRNMTEEIVQEILKYFPVQLFTDATKNLKPAIANQIRVVVSKYVKLFENETNSNNNNSKVNKVNKTNKISYNETKDFSDIDIDDQCGNNNNSTNNLTGLDVSYSNINNTNNTTNIFGKTILSNINNSNYNINNSNYNINNNLNNNYQNNVPFNDVFQQQSFNRGSFNFNNNFNNINKNNYNDQSFIMQTPFQNYNLNNNPNNNQNSPPDLSSILKQIFSDNTTSICQALAALDNILKNEYNKTIPSNTINNEQNLEGIFFALNTMMGTITNNLKSKFNEISINTAVTYDDFQILHYLLETYLTVSKQKNLLHLITESNTIYQCYERLYILINQKCFIFCNSRKEIIEKINSIIMSLLSNCDTTLNMIALIKLIINYKSSTDEYGQICNLAIKCLNKFKNLISSLQQGLNVPKIFIAMYEFYTEFEKTNENLLPHNIYEEHALKIISSIIQEFVKIYGDKIWEVYHNSLNNDMIKNDKYLKRNIQLNLREISNNSNLFMNNNNFKFLNDKNNIQGNNLFEKFQSIDVNEKEKDIFDSKNNNAEENKIQSPLNNNGVLYSNTNEKVENNPKPLSEDKENLDNNLMQWIKKLQNPQLNQNEINNIYNEIVLCLRYNNLPVTVLSTKLEKEHFGKILVLYHCIDNDSKSKSNTILQINDNKNNNINNNVNNKNNVNNTNNTSNNIGSKNFSAVAENKIMHNFRITEQDKRIQEYKSKLLSLSEKPDISSRKINIFENDENKNTNYSVVMNDNNDKKLEATVTTANDLEMRKRQFNLLNALNQGVNNRSVLRLNNMGPVTDNSSDFDFGLLRGNENYASSQGDGRISNNINFMKKRLDEIRKKIVKEKEKNEV